MNTIDAYNSHYGDLIDYCQTLESRLSALEQLGHIMLQASDDHADPKTLAYNTGVHFVSSSGELMGSLTSDADDGGHIGVYTRDTPLGDEGHRTHREKRWQVDAGAKKTQVRTHSSEGKSQHKTSAYGGAAMYTLQTENHAYNLHLSPDGTFSLYNLEENQRVFTTYTKDDGEGAQVLDFHDTEVRGLETR